MKKYLLVFVACMLTIGFVNAQNVTVAGAVTGNGSYATLGAAFTAIGTSQSGAAIVITIVNNTSETAAGATLGAGNWASVTIAPSGGARVISGAATAGTPLVTLNGADNVTINGGGNLTISNTTQSATSGTSTLKLIGDATNNTFNRVTFTGSCTMNYLTNGGLVWISTGSATGNDNNTFESCKFGPAGTNLPSKCIYGNGSTTIAAVGNSGIVINNCELYDYFVDGVSVAGIYAGNGNTNWTITNNKLYQTATRTITSGNFFIYNIYISNATYGANHTITGNTIGYNNNAGTGTMTYIAGTASGGFYGIFFNGLSTATTTTNITNNKIANVQWTSSGASVFYGIWNNISSISTTCPININNDTVQNIATYNSTGVNMMIYAGTGNPLNCNYNVISNISRSGLAELAGLYYPDGNTITIDHNTIANMSNTIATGAVDVYGINSSDAVPNENITNNTIYNLSSATVTTTTVAGINNSDATGTKNIKGNIIYGLSSVNTNGYTMGIRFSSGNFNDISSNTIYGISTTNNVYAIYTMGAGAVLMNIYKNKIYDITTSSTSTNNVALSLNASATTLNCYNNLIGDLRAPFSRSSNGIAGIVINNANATTANVYNNTVMLNATSNSTTTFGTAALYLFSYSTTVLNSRNNILVNTSVAGPTGGVTAALKYLNTPSNYAATSNNNLFYAGTPSATNVIYTETANLSNNQQTLASYKSFMGNRDSISVTEAPHFLSTLGTDNNFLHIDATYPTQIQGGGAALATVTDDFDGEARDATTPDIGADEIVNYGYWTGAVSTDYDVANNWFNNVLPIATTNISIPTGVTNMPVLSTNATVNNIALQPSTTLSINGKTFTINGVVYGSGTLSGSATSSLTIGGAAGTVNFTTGLQTIKDFVLNAGATASLGTPFSIVSTGTVSVGTGATLTTGGNLSFKSDAAGTARIASLLGAINGNVNVERYIPGGRRAYRFLGNPFSNEIALSDYADEVDITGAPGGGFTTNTVNIAPSAYYYDITVGNGSTTNDPGWKPFTTVATTIANGDGFRLYVRGSKNQANIFASPYATPNPVTITVTGTVNPSGDYVKNLVKGTNSGYNLISNPYLSPVNIKTLTKTASVNNNYYVWNARLGTSGGYLTYTFGTNDYALPTMGSFFVNATTAAQTITFKESDKVATDTTTMFKQSPIKGLLEMEVYANGNMYDRFTMYLNEKAKAGYDVLLDAAKFRNGEMNLYSISKDGKPLAIDVRPFEETTIPMGIISNVQRTYSISTHNINFDASVACYLKDNYTGTLTLLQQGTNYSFAVDANAASQGEQRFELVTKQIKPTSLITSSRVEVYPNPTTDMITINYSGLNVKEPTVINIIDANGKVVRTINAGKQSSMHQTINTKSFAAGMYIVELINGKEKQLQSIIKQ